MFPSNFMPRFQLGQAENTTPQEHAPQNQGSHSPDYRTNLSSTLYASDTDLEFSASRPFLNGPSQSSFSTYEDYSQSGPLGSSPFKSATPPTTLMEFDHTSEVVEGTYYQENVGANNFVPSIGSADFFHPPQLSIAGDASQGNFQPNGIQQDLELQITNPTTIPEVSNLMNFGVVGAASYPCNSDCVQGPFPHFCSSSSNQPLIHCVACLFPFSDKTTFDCHYWDEHCTNKVNKVFECQVLGCSRVGEKGIFRKDNFRDHCRRHGANIPKDKRYSRARPGPGGIAGVQRSTKPRVKRAHAYTQVFT